MSPEDDKDTLVQKARLYHNRREKSAREGDLSIGRRLAQIGVLGWLFMTPTLAGLFLGRWLDARFDTGIFWTFPGMILGIFLGGWTAWKWMNTQ